MDFILLQPSVKNNRLVQVIEYSLGANQSHNRLLGATSVEGPGWLRNRLVSVIKSARTQETGLVCPATLSPSCEKVWRGWHTLPSRPGWRSSRSSCLYFCWHVDVHPIPSSDIIGDGSYAWFNTYIGCKHFVCIILCEIFIKIFCFVSQTKIEK